MRLDVGHKAMITTNRPFNTDLIQGELVLILALDLNKRPAQYHVKSLDSQDDSRIHVIQEGDLKALSQVATPPNAYNQISPAGIMSGAAMKLQEKIAREMYQGDGLVKVMWDPAESLKCECGVATLGYGKHSHWCPIKD